MREDLKVHWKEFNKPVGYVRQYAIEHLGKGNAPTTIDPAPQDEDDHPLYSEATLIGLMKSAYYDGYSDREAEVRSQADAAHEKEDVAELVGWCPVCNKVVMSLPHPAEGSCSHCFNHLMKLASAYDLDDAQRENAELTRKLAELTKLKKAAQVLKENGMILDAISCDDCCNDKVAISEDENEQEEITTEQELIIGKNAAIFLVEHMLRMGAARVVIPITINGIEYKAFVESTPEKVC